MNYKEIAEQLIRINALKVNLEQYFTWTSGIESPIYCDNRKTISYSQVRTLIAHSLVQLINENYPEVEMICGCATAGIPHATLVADQMQLPLIYARHKPKAHGLKSQIEGHLNEGEKVVVVEDLISTGGSAINTAKIVKEFGGEVLGIVSIFTYNLEKSKRNFKDSGFKSYSLLNFDQLISILKEQNELNDQEVEELIEWRNNL